MNTAGERFVEPRVFSSKTLRNRSVAGGTVMLRVVGGVGADSPPLEATWALPGETRTRITVVTRADVRQIRFILLLL
jgi:hypothetical protein